MILHVVMTTWLSIWRFFDRPDSLPQLCPSDAMFLLFARILTSDLAVLICRLWGSVPVMRCFVFLRGYWLTIGLSWCCAPEDLSQCYDVPSFCEYIEFQLRCLIFRRNLPSFSATIYFSGWVIWSSGFRLASNFKQRPSLFDYYLCYPVE